MKVLIIGLGNIGKSHLKSFLLSKRKYNIYVYDKIYDYKYFNQKNIKNNKIELLKKFPKSKKFDLCILATNSIERYSILKKLLKYNKIKYMIIEKYIFTKNSHYQIFKKKLFKINHKLFINTWGSIVADKFNLKLVKKNLEFKIEIKDGRFITNAPHFIDFFLYHTERKLENMKIDIKKIINSKRVKYNEILGSITGENKFGNIKLYSKKKIIYDNIKIIDGKNIYKIIIAINKNCTLYKNSILIKKIKFPFAYKETSNIFEDYFIKKKKKHIYSNFKSNYLISNEIVKKISERKKINIT